MNQQQVKIDLSGIAAKVLRRVHRVSHIVRVGLRADAGSHHDVVPGAELEMNISPDPTPTRDELEHSWRLWILNNSFRDIAETVSITLEEIHQVLLLWTIASRDASRPVAFPPDRWASEVRRPVQKFSRLTLPNKLSTLLSDYGFPISETIRQQYLSINAARNCLAHREGVVGDKDADASGSLILYWRSAVLTIEHNGKYTSASDGVLVGPGNIVLRIEDQTRTFLLGEHIQITAIEFVRISWSLWVFAQELASQLEDWGRERGVQFDA